MNRRSFLRGMAGILAAGIAPAVLPSGIIMPVRKLWTPSRWIDSGPITFHGVHNFSELVIYSNPLSPADHLTLSRWMAQQVAQWR